MTKEQILYLEERAKEIRKAGLARRRDSQCTKAVLELPADSEPQGTPVPVILWLIERHIEGTEGRRHSGDEAGDRLQMSFYV